MASQIAQILKQAQLAKSPLFGKLDAVYKNLSIISPDDALHYAPDYLAAVANIVAIDLQNECTPFEVGEALAQEKRRLLMGYLREAKTRPESCGEFLQDVSRLLINVQRVWVALAQDRPVDRFFELGNAYPELILPKSFDMRRYFKANEVTPDAIKVIDFASRIPDLKSGGYVRPTRGEHKTFQ
mgnify:CR=1 FL=1